MKKDQVDLANAVVWIPDSKTPNGIAEVPLTPLAIEAFMSQMAISGEGRFCFRATGIRPDTKTNSKLFGGKLFDGQRSPTFGSTICAPHTPHG